jgi:hypothetical protein
MGGSLSLYLPLLAAATQLFGDRLWLLRLPAVFAAVALIFMTAAFVRLFSRQTPVVIAAALLTMVGGKVVYDAGLSSGPVPERLHRFAKMLALRRRQEAKLLQHTDVVAYAEVADDQAVLHGVPVDVLDLEALAGGRHVDEQAAVDMHPADALVGCGDCHMNDHGVADCGQFLYFHAPVGEGGVDILEYRQYALASHRPAEVIRALGKKLHRGNIVPAVHHVDVAAQDCGVFGGEIGVLDFIVFLIDQVCAAGYGIPHRWNRG